MTNGSHSNIPYYYIIANGFNMIAIVLVSFIFVSVH